MLGSRTARAHDTVGSRLAGGEWRKPGDTMRRMDPAELMAHIRPEDVEMRRHRIDQIADSMSQHGYDTRRGQAHMRKLNPGGTSVDENPVTLWHTDEGSFVEPGNHRVPAAVQAGLPRIPVLVKDRRTRSE